MSNLSIHPLFLYIVPHSTSFIYDYLSLRTYYRHSASESYILRSNVSVNCCSLPIFYSKAEIWWFFVSYIYLSLSFKYSFYPFKILFFVSSYNSRCINRLACSFILAELPGLCYGIRPIFGFSTTLNPFALTTLHDRWLAVSVHYLLWLEFRLVATKFLM